MISISKNWFGTGDMLCMHRPTRTVHKDDVTPVVLVAKCKVVIKTGPASYPLLPRYGEDIIKT
jgi:hypothetical protein